MYGLFSINNPLFFAFVPSFNGRIFPKRQLIRNKMLWSKFLNEVADLSKEAYDIQYPFPGLLFHLPIVDIAEVTLDETSSQFIKHSRVTKLDLLYKSRNLIEAQIVFLTKNRVIVGRESNNDLIFSINEVSRQHAIVITLASNQFAVIDCCSRNGTHLNGQRINGGQPYSLKDKDVIEFGKGVGVAFRSPIGLWEAIEVSKELDKVLA